MNKNSKLIAKNDVGLNFRVKEVKGKSDVSKILFKLPISMICTSAERSLKFYGCTFEEQNIDLYCNTQYIGRNYERFINTTYTEEFKTEVNRTTSVKDYKPDLSRNSRNLRRSMITCKISLTKLSMEEILEKYKVSKVSEAFIHSLRPQVVDVPVLNPENESLLNLEISTRVNPDFMTPLNQELTPLNTAILTPLNQEILTPSVTDSETGSIMSLLDCTENDSESFNASLIRCADSSRSDTAKKIHSNDFCNNFNNNNNNNTLSHTFTQLENQPLEIERLNANVDILPSSTKDEFCIEDLAPANKRAKQEVNLNKFSVRNNAKENFNYQKYQHTIYNQSIAQPTKHFRVNYNTPSSSSSESNFNFNYFGLKISNVTFESRTKKNRRNTSLKRKTSSKRNNTSQKKQINSEGFHISDIIDIIDITDL